MFRTISRLTTIFLLTTVLAACTLPSFLPPIEFDTMLLPGTSVVTAEDVYLGATAGALEGMTMFGVDEVSEPRDTDPFPNARVLGNYVRVAAERDLATPATEPLLLGLPVPAGVDTERLALAVLVPAETVHIDTSDEEENDTLAEPRDTWVLVDGRFDPEGRRLVTTLTGLPEGGFTAVLVESGAFGSPPLELWSAGLEHQQVAVGFEARCVGFADLNRANECTAADEAFMTGELENVFRDLEALGFLAPELHLEFDIISLNPPGALPLTYVAKLHPYVTTGESGTLCLVTMAGSGNHGRYTVSLKRVAVCWGEPELTNGGANYNGPRIDNLRHEYFHAIQYAYSDSATGWFKESTAVMAEDSLATMVRDTGRAVRDVDVQMNAKPQWYSLQDFWIYLGMRVNLGLADVIPFLEAGGDEAALDAVFASDYPQLGSLAEAYWAWVKNQSFEKVFALGRNGFATLCGLDTNSSGAYYALDNNANPGGAPVVLSFDFVAPPGDVNFVLPPLTSRVYQLDFNAMPSAEYDTTVMVSGGATVNSKFYDPANTGTNGCVNDADSDALPMTVAAGQDETRFVLIANTSSSSNQAVTVSFAGDSNPTIDIVSPLQNAVFDENDLITFNAIASGFTGANPALVNITWSYVPARRRDDRVRE